MEHNEQVLSERTFKGRKAKKGLRFAVGVTGLIFLVELIGGWVSGSLALMADAGHMATDLFALSISYLAIRLSARPSTKKDPTAISGSKSSLPSLTESFSVSQLFLSPLKRGKEFPCLKKSIAPKCWFSELSA